MLKSEKLMLLTMTMALVWLVVLAAVGAEIYALLWLDDTPTALRYQAVSFIGVFVQWLLHKTFEKVKHGN